MKKYFRSIIYILFSLVRFSIIKLFRFNNFDFFPVTFFSPFVEIEIGKRSFLKISRFVKAKSGVKIKIRNGANVHIGESTSFNHGCMLVSHEKIEIGKNVQIGPNVLIYDHDHDYRTAGGLKGLKYITSPVIVGNNVWIGANVIILKGTTIGSNCVIAAGSIIKGNFPDNTVVLQKKETTILEGGVNQ